MKEQKVMTPQKRASKKFRENNPEKTRLWTYRSKGKKYIREHATKEDLDEFLELITGRYNELGISTKNMTFGEEETSYY